MESCRYVEWTAPTCKKIIVTMEKESCCLFCEIVGCIEVGWNIRKCNEIPFDPIKNGVVFDCNMAGILSWLASFAHHAGALVIFKNNGGVLLFDA